MSNTNIVAVIQQQLKDCQDKNTKLAVIVNQMANAMILLISGNHEKAIDLFQSVLEQLENIKEQMESVK